MKATAMIIAILFFSANVEAQNKNVQSTTKTTTTTVKDGMGKNEVFVKKEKVVETQKIELKDAKPNTLNIEMKDSPVSVTTTTQITNPDGSTRTTSIDRSGYYVSDNMKYKVDLDPQGYTFITEGLAKPYLLRRTSTNSYIYFNEGKVAVSYFDTDGNLIVETYNDKTDAVEYRKYMMIKD
jgi:hypothetical protein